MRRVSADPSPRVALALERHSASRGWRHAQIGKVVGREIEVPVTSGLILPPRPSRTLSYRSELAAKIRRRRYKSRTRGTTNTGPHQCPVAQSTTTTAVIQMASSSRITSEDFRCRRPQFIVAKCQPQAALTDIPSQNLRCWTHQRRAGIRQLFCDQSAAEQGDRFTRLHPNSWSPRALSRRS